MTGKQARIAFSVWRGRRGRALLVAALGLGLACRRGSGSIMADGAGGTGSSPAAAGGGAGSGGAPSGASGGGGGGDAAWTQVPNTGPCVLEVADTSKLQVLPFTWTACGPGCTTTPVKVLPTDDGVIAGVASAAVEGDDVIVRLGTMRASTYYMIVTRRLSDGALLGAVRAPGPTQTTCGPLGFAPSAPRTFPFGKGSTIVVGWLKTPAAPSFVWSPALADIPLPQASIFQGDRGWGIALADSSLRVMFPSESGVLVSIDQGTYPAYSAVARGDLVVSNPAMAGSADEVIRVWTPNHAPATLVTQANTGVPSLAMSDTSLVWAGTHGPERTSGAYTAVELYWAATPVGTNPISIQGSVSLPATSGLLSLQTGGDFAAVTGNDDAQRLVLFVVRLSDGHVWSVRARPGTAYTLILAVSAHDVIFAEIDTGNPSLGWQIQRMTRYDLTRLDELASAW